MEFSTWMIHRSTTTITKTSRIRIDRSRACRSMTSRMVTRETRAITCRGNYNIKRTLVNRPTTTKTHSRMMVTAETTTCGEPDPMSHDFSVAHVEAHHLGEFSIIYRCFARKGIFYWVRGWSFVHCGDGGRRLIPDPWLHPHPFLSIPCSLTT